MSEFSPRISASSYSNTAPLIWSFLYGSRRGNVELILDTAPARSVDFIREDRVDVGLAPLFAYQLLDGVKLVPDVCVGAKERVRSVCLMTDGRELESVKSVALDTSSRTSAALTKIIFNEFLAADPIWTDSRPDIEKMLAAADCALLIGDPALSLDETKYRKFDLVELWKSFTGLGFIFAMWMTKRNECNVDLAAARDEGLENADKIVANYRGLVSLSDDEMHDYLTKNISYSIDESMQKGLELYFSLAQKHGLIATNKDLQFV